MRMPTGISAGTLLFVLLQPTQTVMAQSTASPPHAVNPGVAPPPAPPQAVTAAGAGPAAGETMMRVPTSPVLLETTRGAKHVGEIIEDSDGHSVNLKNARGELIRIESADIKKRTDFASESEASQALTRVVVMRDGTVFRGRLVSAVPGDQIFLQLGNGQFRRIAFTDILSLNMDVAEVQLPSRMILPVKAQFRLLDGTIWNGDLVQSRMGETFTIQLATGQTRTALWRDVRGLQRRPDVQSTAPNAPQYGVARSAPELGGGPSVDVYRDAGVGVRIEAAAKALDGRPVEVSIEGEFVELDGDSPNLREAAQELGKWSWVRGVGIAASIVEDVRYKRMHSWNTLCRLPCTLYPSGQRKLRLVAHGIGRGNVFSLSEQGVSTGQILQVETRHTRPGLLAGGIILEAAGFFGTVGSAVAFSKSTAAGATVLSLGLASGIAGGVLIWQGARRIGFRFTPRRSTMAHLGIGPVFLTGSGLAF